MLNKLKEQLLLFYLIFMRGGDIMQVIATTYVSLIVAGRRTFSQVPSPVREMVRADLEALGYDFGSETV